MTEPVSQRIAKKLEEIRAAEERDRELFLGVLGAFGRDEDLWTYGLKAERHGPVGLVRYEGSQLLEYWAEGGEVMVRWYKEGEGLVESSPDVETALDRMAAIMATTVHVVRGKTA